jgi:hypothetical protein
VSPEDERGDQPSAEIPRGMAAGDKNNRLSQPAMINENILNTL